MEIFKNAVVASRKLNMVSNETVNKVLLAVAKRAVERAEDIVEANSLDLKAMSCGNPMYDRLLLNKDRIKSIAEDMRNVAALGSPLGKILSQTTHSNGMKITKISVPFGVIGIIYEARPNVSFDVFSLCLKSGNACILKGGSDAHHSNSIIVAIIKEVLQEFNIDTNTVTLMPADRAATKELLDAVGYVDLIIPRGSSGLISFVRDNAKVPVIETGAGICHAYFDIDGDKNKGAAIINNAKTRRISVCNALDCLIINKNRIDDLPFLCSKLSDSNVIIYADAPAYSALKGKYPEELLQQATEESFGIEFLSYKMSIRTVNDLNDAIEHIARYSSKHSETIISDNDATVKLYQKIVDAACVYANVSTAFTDGAQFGLGAEIGISTQKLHARGPMGLGELTSYKYIIDGSGQIRG